MPTHNTSSSFSQLPLPKGLLSNIESLGYKEMTPIQRDSLPIILQGKDIIAKAKTGSGKTAALGLGLLSKLEVKRFRIQALVLCPTRELADQVAKEIRRLARAIHNIKVLTLCGGMPFGPQVGSLEHGAHIVVGTPGRIVEHLNKQRLDLSHLETLVFDEADRMLDMGFEDAIRTIASFTPKQKQTLLFSATYPKEIESIARDYLNNPTRVEAESVQAHSHIEQHFYCVEKDEKLHATQKLLLNYKPESSIIFCNTKRETQRISDELFALGFTSLAIHGDLDQREREQTLVRFANKSCAVLVATDVAARGLDIDALDLVINYEMSRDPEVHVHRVGRTGRAGKYGLACSLYSKSEWYKVEALNDLHNLAITPNVLPDIDTDIHRPEKPHMVTLQIDGGKKQKVRAGDILGALTSKGDLAASDVGKISIFDFCAYVAVARPARNKALNKLKNDNIKGRKFKIRLIR